MTRFYFNDIDCSRFSRVKDFRNDMIFSKDFLDWARDRNIRFCSNNRFTSGIVDMLVGDLTMEIFKDTLTSLDSIVIDDIDTAILFKLMWT